MCACERTSRCRPSERRRGSASGVTIASRASAAIVARRMRVRRGPGRLRSSGSVICVSRTHARSGVHGTTPGCDPDRQLPGRRQIMHRRRSCTKFFHHDPHSLRCETGSRRTPGKRRQITVPVACAQAGTRGHVIGKRTLTTNRYNALYTGL